MWRQLSVATEEALVEPVSDLFSDLGALSVTYEDEGDQPIFEPKPGETPVWLRTRVTGLFEHDVELDLVRAGLIAHFGKQRLQNWRCEEIQDQAWERAWLEHFKPMRFGRRLWIVPTGFEAPQDPEAVCVNLDPGLAFGTGTHPTTALCLQWLDSLDLRGMTVIDYGCGSGILAVAALLLGAESAVAVDIDAQALTATRDNALKNRVGDRIQAYVPKHMPNIQADLLIANILANPLIELAPMLAESVRPGGQLALSGILRDQWSAVASAYRTDFDMQAPVFLEDWSRLSGTRKV